MSLRKWNLVLPDIVAQVLQGDTDEVLLIDSRSFLEYNTCHIYNAINVCCSKLVKRRLQQNKISIIELLKCSTNLEANLERSVFVYDQMTNDPKSLQKDCFLYVLFSKLQEIFSQVSLLKGGFIAFKNCYPSLCDNSNKSGSDFKTTTLTTISQPCMPISSHGPTKILPFLYLGSQDDAAKPIFFQQQSITHILNVSSQCPKPDHVSESHFYRISINDNYSSRLLPYLEPAFDFINKVKEGNGRVLVHCMAGISRSPALAIAYIMKYYKMSTDDAYKFVKEKRPTISPNFNFLGQLLEYEKLLKGDQNTVGVVNMAESPIVAPTFLQFKRKTVQAAPPTLNSPTTALSLLNFSEFDSSKIKPIVQLREKPQQTACIKLSKPPTKRPHSLGVDTPLLALSSQSQSTSNKRPTVRPSSIAFIGTPLSPQQEESSTPEKSNTSLANQSIEVSETCENVTSARRSRSIDDLLNEKDDNVDDEQTGACSFRRDRKLYSSIDDCNKNIRKSSATSPVSSSGSSLQGSCELIPVV